MAETMIASDEMTGRQIETALDQVRAAMRKHSSEIPKEIAQQVLGVDNLGMQMFAVFRKQAEMFSNMIVHRWKASLMPSPMEVLKATGRRLYVDDAVVSAMPRGTGEEGKTIFFPLDLSKRGGHISDDDLEKEFESHGLLPEYPDNLADVNKADPAFADEHPNCTHWKDKNGKWCYAAFDRWDGERLVSVDRHHRGWDGRWWVAGRRK